MKRCFLILLLGLASIALLFLIWQARPGRVLRIRDGRIIDLNEMIEEVKGSRLIFVGENHDLMENHRAELEIVKKLHDKGVPVAIGLEMFTSRSQGVLDRWVAGTITPVDFIRDYYQEWALPWPLYRRIFIYARKHGIPLVGLNIPRRVSRKVARVGFAALTPAERRELPAGVSCSVDPVYRQFIRRAYAAHEESEASFDHFCEAQMLWNVSMGMHVLEFSNRHPGTAMVVLAGVGHAMKQGIPYEVSRRSGSPSQVILPELPRFDRSSVTTSDADYLLLSGFLR
jgi:uncharacterized iron-regulated protein